MLLPIGHITFIRCIPVEAYRTLRGDHDRFFVHREVFSAQTTPANTDMLPKLANAELAVMELLWDHTDPMTAREIRERLYPDATRAQHGTVQRLLQRLEQKGFVTRDRRLSVHLFQSTVSREDYASQQLESLANRLTSGSIAPLITHLVQQNRISQSELDRIRAFIDQYDPDSPGPSDPPSNANPTNTATISNDSHIATPRSGPATSNTSTDSATQPDKGGRHA